MTSVAPRLVVFSGLPGVGKSTIARAVADKLEAVWLRVDMIEAAMLKAGVPRSFETGLAAYLAAQEVAAEHLQLGRAVVIDAVNGVEPARQMWRDLAVRSHAALRVIEVTCPDVVEHRRRVEVETRGTPPLPAPTWDEVVHREYVPWRDPALTVDGTASVARNVERILAYCR